MTDLVLVSLVVHETGGWDSSLNFLYPLVIIVASVLLPRIWAQLVAALAFILYRDRPGTRLLRVIPSYCTTHPGLKALQAIIFVNLFAFLAVAYLAGLLTAKLRQVGVQLKDTSGALESLQALHENIIHSISSGLITTGLDGRITLVNAPAQRFWIAPPRNCLRKAASISCFSIPCPTVESPQTHGEVRFDARNEIPQNGSGAGSGPDRAGARRAGICLRSSTISPRFAAWSAKFACRTAWPLWAGWPPPLPMKSAIPLTSIAGSVSMLSGCARDERGAPPPARHRHARVAAA